MTGSASFSPTALAALFPVSLTLLCLPPVYFSPFNSRILFGSTQKKRPNSSELNISCNFYLDSIVGRSISFQCAVIFSVHDFTSPYTVLNVTLFCAFHLSTHPFDALKSSMPSFLLNYLLSPEEPVQSQVCFDLADTNHLKTALPKSLCFLALTFFLFKLIVPEENVAIVFICR